MPGQAQLLASFDALDYELAQLEINLKEYYAL